VDNTRVYQGENDEELQQNYPLASDKRGQGAPSETLFL